MKNKGIYKQLKKSMKVAKSVISLINDGDVKGVTVSEGKVYIYLKINKKTPSDVIGKYKFTVNNFRFLKTLKTTVDGKKVDIYEIKEEGEKL